MEKNSPNQGVSREQLLDLVDAVMVGIDAMQGSCPCGRKRECGGLRGTAMMNQMRVDDGRVNWGGAVIIHKEMAKQGLAAQNYLDEQLLKIPKVSNHNHLEKKG